MGRVAEARAAVELAHRLGLVDATFFEIRRRVGIREEDVRSWEGVVEQISFLIGGVLGIGSHADTVDLCGVMRMMAPHADCRDNFGRSLMWAVCRLLCVGGGRHGQAGVAGDSIYARLGWFDAAEGQNKGGVDKRPSQAGDKKAPSSGDHDGGDESPTSLLGAAQPSSPSDPVRDPLKALARADPAIARPEALFLLRFLLHEMKASPRQRFVDGSRRTPLLYAAWALALEAMAALLEAGAPVDDCDDDGWTPLLVAVHQICAAGAGGATYEYSGAAALPCSLATTSLPAVDNDTRVPQRAYGRSMTMDVGALLVPGANRQDLFGSAGNAGGLTRSVTSHIGPFGAHRATDAFLDGASSTQSSQNTFASPYGGTDGPSPASSVGGYNALGSLPAGGSGAYPDAISGLASNGRDELSSLPVVGTTGLFDDAPATVATVATAAAAKSGDLLSAGFWDIVVDSPQLQPVKTSPIPTELPEVVMTSPTVAQGPHFWGAADPLIPEGDVLTLPPSIADAPGLAGTLYGGSPLARDALRATYTATGAAAGTYSLFSEPEPVVPPPVPAPVPVSAPSDGLAVGAAPVAGAGPALDPLFAPLPMSDALVASGADPCTGAAFASLFGDEMLNPGRSLDDLASIPMPPGVVDPIFSPPIIATVPPAGRDLTGGLTSPRLMLDEPGDEPPPQQEVLSPPHDALLEAISSAEGVATSAGASSMAASSPITSTRGAAVDPNFSPPPAPPVPAIPAPPPALAPPPMPPRASLPQPPPASLPQPPAPSMARSTSSVSAISPVAGAAESLSSLSLASSHGTTQTADLTRSTTGAMMTPSPVPPPATPPQEQQILDLLLHHGASLTAATRRGVTALHLAAAIGDLGLLRYLLAAGAPVGGRDAMGRTPVMVFLEREGSWPGDWGLVREGIALLSSAATAQGGSTLAYSAEQDVKVALFRMLLCAAASYVTPLELQPPHAAPAGWADHAFGSGALGRTTSQRQRWAEAAAGHRCALDAYIRHVVALLEQVSGRSLKMPSPPAGKARGSAAAYVVIQEGLEGGSSRGGDASSRAGGSGDLYIDIHAAIMRCVPDVCLCVYDNDMAMLNNNEKAWLLHLSKPFPAECRPPAGNIAAPLNGHRMATQGSALVADDGMVLASLGGSCDRFVSRVMVDAFPSLVQRPLAYHFARGQPLACDDAIRILAQHGPLVQFAMAHEPAEAEVAGVPGDNHRVAAGHDYWARLLLAAGVDVLLLLGQCPCMEELVMGVSGRDAREAAPEVTALDATSAHADGLTVIPGCNPSVLHRYQNRALLLASPCPSVPASGDSPLEWDAACVHHFSGDVVVCLGEWKGRTAMDVGTMRYGQSRSERCQLALEEGFEAVTHLSLPNWPWCKNSLTVWKRRLPFTVP
eukprot:jgi/Mesvir1/27925/Mv20144-RA.2